MPAMAGDEQPGSIPSSPPPPNDGRNGDADSSGTEAASPMDVDMADASDNSKPKRGDSLKPKGRKKELQDEDLDALLSEDLDDEMVQESYNHTPSVSTPQSLLPVQSDYSDPEVMRAFYQRLFPFRIFFQWLNHSPAPSPDFSNREFAFTLQNKGYLRFQSFPTADLLRRQCIEMLPTRFEIGPVYSINPRDRKTLQGSNAMKPVSKELVFDIDMTDYDPIRTCCSGANICQLCWSFITMAIKVVDAALRDDFGYEHIMWVYSGRRGAHAWVCDKRARDLTDQQRKSIAGYLELIKDSNVNEKKVNERRPLHPHVDRSLRLLRTHFQTDILRNQDPWSGPDRSKRLLALLGEFPALTAALARKWASCPDRSSTAKWADIDAEASTLASDQSSSSSSGAAAGSNNNNNNNNSSSSSSSTPFKPEALLEAKQDIVLEYTYARLDAEVSKKRNHLLKAPFAVHPGTGRVCVPIDMDRFEQFDPASVPVVTDLLQQIDEWDRRNAKADGEEAGDEVGGNEAGGQGETKSEAARASAPPSGSKRIPDWDKTDLKPYVAYFRQFVARLIRAEHARTKRERAKGADEDGDDEGGFGVKQEGGGDLATAW